MVRLPIDLVLIILIHGFGNQAERYRINGSTHKDRYLGLCADVRLSQVPNILFFCTYLT